MELVDGVPITEQVQRAGLSIQEWIELFCLQTATGRMLSSVPAHSNQLLTMDLSREARTLITVGFDSSMALWVVAVSRELARYQDRGSTISAAELVAHIDSLTLEPELRRSVRNEILRHTNLPG